MSDRLIKSFDPNGEFRPGAKSAADATICKQALAVLQHHYGAHLWVVSCNSQQGIMTIGVPELCEWAYVLHLTTVFSDPSLKCVVRGAGEFLERYKIPRSNMNMDAYYAALAARPLGYRMGPPQ
jgi:hypothetical protein